MASFFVFGLHVPKLSVISVYILFLLTSVFLMLKGQFFKAIWIFPNIESVLLFSFSFTYYLIIYVHGFIELPNAIINIIMMQSVYIIGLNLGSFPIRHYPVAMYFALMSLLAGLTVFPFLSVIHDYDFGNFHIDRYAASIWAAGNPVNSPILGLYASIGMCLMPTLLCGIRSFGRMYVPLIVLTISSISFCGLYVNIALQNRSPFIALVIVAIALISIEIYRALSIKKERLIALVRSLVIGAATVGLMLWMVSVLSDFGIYERFQIFGLNSPRYELWVMGLSIDYYGGRTAYIANYSYFHNLWLDIAYDAGFIPVVFLALFHVKHLKHVLSLLRSSVPKLLLGTVVSVGISISIGYLVEPVLQGSVIYFSATLLFLAIIVNLSEYYSKFNIRS